MHASAYLPGRLRPIAGLAITGLLLLDAAPLHAQTAYTWNGGTGNWSNGALWSTGSLPGSADADVYIDGGKTGTASVVSLDNNYTFGRLTLDAGDTLNVVNNVEFTVSNGAFTGSGSLVNNGTINFNDNNNGTFLHFAGAGSISGTGTVNLNGPNSRIFVNNLNDRITVGASQTIAGRGNVGNGQSSVTNNGTLTANQNGATLVLAPTNNGTQGDFTNAGAGISRAENGGTLELAGSNGATFNGGTFSALTGSTVQIDNNVTVNNTTLATSGTGVVSATNVNATLNNVTVASGSTVNVNNNSAVTLTGTLTNNGTVSVTSTGSGTYLQLGGATTLGGSGTVNLNGPNSRLFANNAGDRLTIDYGQSVSGQGNLGNGTTTITNNGNIVANVSGATLTVQPGGGTADFTSNGGVTVFNGASLAVSGSSGGTMANNGFISVGGGTSAGANSSFAVDAGRFTNLANGTLTGGSYSVTGGTSVLRGTATLNLGGNVTTNAAVISLTGAGATFTGLDTLANNQGFLVVDTNQTFTTTGALANSGTLVAQNGASVRVTGALTQTSSGLLGGANGTFVASSFALSGLVGPHAQSAYNAGATGLLTPAASLTLQGTAAFNANTVLFLALGATGSANSDQLNVGGAFTLDGRLDVAGLTGFGVGRYDLLDYTGALTNNGLDLGTLPAGYNYAIDTSIGGQVDLVVTNAVPEPSTWAAVLGGGLLAFALRRRVTSQP